MSEEEIIEMLKEYSATNPFQKSMFYVSNLHEAIQGILDLYQKEKQKNKKLESRKYMLNAETGEVTAIPIDNNYILKSKVRELINKRGNNGYTSLDCIEDIEKLLEERN